MKIIIKFLLYYLQSLLRKTISFVPRDKNIWVYGGIGDRFVDNSKYFFIYANENINQVKHIWIASSENEVNYLRGLGFFSFKKNSLRGMYFAFRAKVYIFSSNRTDVSYLFLSSGAFLFNLWHGLPLKKIVLDDKMLEINGIKNKFEKYLEKKYYRLIIHSDAILCPVDFFKNIFVSAFDMKNISDLCFVRYPRTAPFFWSEAQLNKHIEKFESMELKNLIERCKSYNEVWIYMPTFRDRNPNFIHDAIEDIEQLNEVCAKKGILFLLKLHYHTNVDFFVNKYSNIILLDNKLDVYPLLPSTTTLLTDYSSIFIDYYALTKRVVFYPYDLSDYLANNREMYFNYDEIAKGDKVYNFNDLTEYLNSAKVNVLSNTEISFLYPDEEKDIQNIGDYILNKTVHL